MSTHKEVIEAINKYGLPKEAFRLTAFRNFFQIGFSSIGKPSEDAYYNAIKLLQGVKNDKA